LGRPRHRRGVRCDADRPPRLTRGRGIRFGEGDRAIIDAVGQVAEQRGIPMAQVAMAWVLKNPVVAAPIVGPTKPHHLADAAAALDVRLTDDEIRVLEEPYTPRLPTGF
jgi:1-deoxyxylulose-5-phosphate synthase